MWVQVYKLSRVKTIRIAASSVMDKPSGTFTVTLTSRGSLLSLERLDRRWPLRQGREGAALVADIVESCGVEVLVVRCVAGEIKEYRYGDRASCEMVLIIKCDLYMMIIARIESLEPSTCASPFTFMLPLRGVSQGGLHTSVQVLEMSQMTNKSTTDDVTRVAVLRSSLCLWRWTRRLTFRASTLISV